MKLKKGSAAAKAYMAKIRAKRKKVTKSSVAKPKRAAKKAVKAAKKKAAKKETSIHKDTASHNVRISVVSGVSKKSTQKSLINEKIFELYDFAQLMSRHKFGPGERSQEIYKTYKKTIPIAIKELKKLGVKESTHPIFKMAVIHYNSFK